MITITCLFGNSNWTFTFREPSKADRVYKGLVTYSESEILEIEDDFGIKAAIMSTPKCVQRSDTEKFLEGQAMMGLMQERARAKMTEMVRKDPSLMFLNGSGATVVPAGSKIIRPG